MEDSSELRIVEDRLSTTTATHTPATTMTTEDTAAAPSSSGPAATTSPPPLPKVTVLTTETDENKPITEITIMGDMGPMKDLLRERIKNKRVHEGLDDISAEELFAKKPRYDLSEDEKDRLQERRKRNKEAAEKSRKKKKEEFEKLQIENDQLAQDKCEMAAMIEKLKKDLQGVQKENGDLRTNLDGLKRWIGKKAQTLGLVDKQPAVSRAEKMAVDSGGKSFLTRGDPSLQSAENLPKERGDEEFTAMNFTTPPSPPLSPPTLSPHTNLTPPPAHQNSAQSLFKVPQSPPQLSRNTPSPEFKPVGIRTLNHAALNPAAPAAPKHHGLQTPWIVEQPSHPEDLSTTAETENVTTSVSTPSRVTASPPAMVKPAVSLASQSQTSEQQQVIYLPKDTFFIVNNSLPGLSLASCLQNQQVAVVAPNMSATSLPEEVKASEVCAAVTRPQSAPAPPSLPVSLPVSVPISVPLRGLLGKVLRGDAIYTSPPPRSQPTTTPMEITPTSIYTTALSTPIPTSSPATTDPSDPSVKTAIESLLKLGYKIQMSPPSGTTQQFLVSSSGASQAEYNQQAPRFVTVSSPGLMETSGKIIRSSA